MNILVVGGSYFYGRVFVMEAAREHGGQHITVLNRGTYTMAEFGVRQITGDRHDPAVFEVCTEDYDAVVDFCAYDAGDVKRVIENLRGKIRQYVMISTVDVYERGSGAVKTEEHALERRELPGEAGAYIAGKVALEDEIRNICSSRQIPYTILRPAILYGPYNYAPRESVYIQMMITNHVLPRFTDADGQFQFVYIKDAAQAIQRVLGNEKAFGQAYNLCQDEILTYERFFTALKKAAEPEVAGRLQELMVTVDEAVNGQIPLPYPAMAEETELCSNAKGKRELGLEYTDFTEGMNRTYRAFRNVFS